jgi:hypothetical protein
VRFEERRLVRRNFPIRLPIYLRTGKEQPIRLRHKQSLTPTQAGPPKSLSQNRFAQIVKLRDSLDYPDSHNRFWDSL